MVIGLGTAGNLNCWPIEQVPSFDSPDRSYNCRGNNGDFDWEDCARYFKVHKQSFERQCDILKNPSPWSTSAHTVVHAFTTEVSTLFVVKRMEKAISHKKTNPKIVYTVLFTQLYSVSLSLIHQMVSHFIISLHYSMYLLKPIPGTKSCLPRTTVSPKMEHCMSKQPQNGTVHNTSSYLPQAAGLPLQMLWHTDDKKTFPWVTHSCSK